METDNVPYLLSSCLDEEIRRSVFAGAHAGMPACTYCVSVRKA